MAEETKKAKGGKRSEVDPVTILSYLGILCLVPLFTRKEDKFAQFHAKQGLVLLIGEVVTMAISWIPLFGASLASVLWIAWIGFSVIGIIYVVQGDKKKLPLIGDFADKIKL
jgi:fumarate reductase subunit D